MDRHQRLTTQYQHIVQRLTGSPSGAADAVIDTERPPVLFWRETDATERGCFSQWFMRDFTVDGQRYCCMEQYMMAQKARLCGDSETLDRILASADASVIKRLGREVRGFVPEQWDRHKCDIVYHGNLSKFSQNPDLLRILLATAPRLLAEASPYDRIWGIGLGADDPRADDPGQWRGQNLLGFILMAVRSALRG